MNLLSFWIKKSPSLRLLLQSETKDLVLRGTTLHFTAIAAHLSDTGVIFTLYPAPVTVGFRLRLLLQST